MENENKKTNKGSIWSRVGLYLLIFMLSGGIIYFLMLNSYKDSEIDRLNNDIDILNQRIYELENQIKGEVNGVSANKPNAIGFTLNEGLGSYILNFNNLMDQWNVNFLSLADEYTLKTNRITNPYQDEQNIKLNTILQVFDGQLFFEVYPTKLDIDCDCTKKTEIVEVWGEEFEFVYTNENNQTGYLYIIGKENPDRRFTLVIKNYDRGELSKVIELLSKTQFNLDI